MLIQLEIFFFFSSLIYIFYYFIDKWIVWYKDKKIILQEKIEKKELREKLRLEQIENSQLQVLKEETNDQKKINKKEDKKYLNAEEGEQIREIAKRANINISRWYLESARSLIIEWLALKKKDKELNLLLADLYEKEKKYQNAAYIFEDMIEYYGEESYMLQKLWNIYTLLEKDKKAFKIYEEAYKKDRGNVEILDILAHLALEITDYKKAMKYANMYLKEKPRNAEKLWVKWYALEKMWKSIEAIKSYEQVLQIQPYNTEIQDRIKKLEEK